MPTTDLAGIGEGSVRHALDGAFQIAVGEDDCRIFATQFENHGNEARCCAGGHTHVRWRYCP